LDTLAVGRRYGEKTKGLTAGGSGFRLSVDEPIIKLKLERSGRRHSVKIHILLLTVFMTALAAPGWAQQSIQDAARDGDLARVKAIAEADPTQVNAKNQHGSTALHWAAIKGHDDVARYLLSKGAQVNIKDTNGFTPLHRAAYWGSLDVAQTLIAGKANVNAKDNEGLTPLAWAKKQSQKALVDLLTQSGGKD
jgi:hypothetical protein